MKDVGKNETWEKGKWKLYLCLLDIKAVGKNIKWGRGERAEKFWEENED